MKKQVLAFYLASVLFSFNACNTENEQINNVLPIYLPMSVGNYWIYQHFVIDSLGNERSLNLFDSVVIIKDTLINNELYYMFGGRQNEPSFPKFLRYSDGYLIRNNGEKIFSTTDFKNILYERDDSVQIKDKYYFIYLLKIKMESIPKLIKTPAGEFSTLNAGGYLTLYYYDDLAELIDSIITDQNTYYAQNVGIVVQTYQYYFDVKYLKRKYEKRLIRYKINK